MRHNREEKVEKMKKFLVYFIGFIMVFSAFGVIFFGYGESTTTLKYKNFKFTSKGSSWSTMINEKEALFTYFPSDVESINASNDMLNRLKNILEIDATSEFNDTFAKQISLAEYNMGLTLNNFNVFLRQGFTTKTQYNFPVITCNDSTPSVPVIYFKKSNETKVYLENNCIIAEALRQDDVERIKDRLMYGILGVIE